MSRRTYTCRSCEQGPCELLIKVGAAELKYDMIPGRLCPVSIHRDACWRYVKDEWRCYNDDHGAC